MRRDAYTQLIEKLDLFIKKYYKNQLLKGVILFVAVFFILLLFVSTLEYLGRFSVLIRTILFYSTSIVILGILYKFIFIPLKGLLKIGKIISNEQAAVIVGQHFADVQDKLLNILQLKKMADESAQSNELLMAGIEQKTLELKPINFTQAISFSENKKYLRYALPPLGIFIFMIFAAPNVVKESSYRLIQYNKEFIPEAPFTFNILNENLIAVENEDFEVKVELKGKEIPEEVFIEIDGNLFRMNKKEKNQHRFLLKNIRKNTNFRLFADNFYSEQNQIEIKSKPLITNLSIKLEYPAYLSKPNETIKNTGDLVVPQGTIIQWQFETKNTDKISIQINDTLLNTTQSGLRFVQRYKAMKSNSYAIITQNSNFATPDSLQYLLQVIPDAFPEIRVTEFKDSTSNTRLYFRGEIKDDYGFRKLGFYYAKTNSDKFPSESEFKYEDLNIGKNITSQSFIHFIDLKKIDIQPGETFHYFFRVWDNDGVNGSKSSKTTLMTFKVPTKEELEQQKEERNENFKADVRESMDKAKDAQKSLENFKKDLLQKKNTDWEDRKKLEELLKQQRDLEKSIEDLKKENERNKNKDNEFDPKTQEELRKQEELQKKLDELMTEDMKKLLEEIEKAMENLDKKKLQELIKQIENNTQDLQKQLEKTLELFKQMEFEQKLQDVIDKLEELSQKQEDLANDTENKSKSQDELKKQQEELNKEFDKLKEDFDKLEEKNNELENKNNLPDTKSEQQDIEQEMKKSKEQLDKNQNKKASESQKSAADKMKELFQKMSEMQAQMSQEKQQENMDDLRQVLENLLTVSFEQEALMEDLKKTNPNSAKYRELVQKQKKLQDDMKIIEDSLFALSKRVIELETFVLRELGQIKNNMEQSVDFLADRKTGVATGKQQYALTSINNLALMLSELLEQMQQQMAAMMMGTASCPKPGQGQPKDMKSLMEMQQKLSENMKKMAEQIKKGNGKSGKEGEKEGQGDKKDGKGEAGEGENQSREIARMAAIQEQIRRELQKMAESLTGEEKRKLNELLQKMEENEIDLYNKRITAETIKRQNEILVRMLEHEKAQREQEQDEKRQSKESDKYQEDTRRVMLEYLKMKEKETELLRKIPPSLTPYYKIKVNEYFNKL